MYYSMSTSSPPRVHPYKFIKSEYNPNFNSRVPIKVLTSPLLVTYESQAPAECTDSLPELLGNKKIKKECKIKYKRQHKTY